MVPGQRIAERIELDPDRLVADLAVAAHLPEEFAELRIRMVDEQPDDMELTAAEGGRNLDSGDRFELRKRPGRFEKFRDAADRVVIGQRNGGETGFRGERGERGGSVAPVRRTAVYM